MALKRCPCCGQLIMEIDDSSVLDKKRRGEFTHSDYARRHGLTMAQAKSALNKMLKVSMCARRKCGKTWLYRNER